MPGKKGRTGQRAQQGWAKHKIHAVVDALGNPIRIHLTASQQCELDGADVLLPGLKAKTMIADKGFDADARVLEPLRASGKQAVIPARAKRLHSRTYDLELYKRRHLIENFFART